MTTTASRRYRWRADLREYTGEALTGAGLTNQGTEQSEAAKIEREYADLLDELQNAKDAGDKEVIREVGKRVCDYRGFFRDEGLTIVPVDEFEEPSDDELNVGN